MSNDRINYAVCDGIIEQFGIWGACDYWRVHVSYTVDGKTYSLTESVKLVSKTIRLGPIPIGQKKEPKLPSPFRCYSCQCPATRGGRIPENVSAVYRLE